MKPVVAFAATFGIALIVSTGAKVMLTKAPVAKHTAADSAAVADSIAKDSVTSKGSADSTHKDSAVAAVPRPVTPVVDSANTRGVKAVGNPKAPGPASPPVAVATAPDTVVQGTERRLAKIFTSMDPKQAAKVLGNMSDGDVKIILGYVGPRQAASIMAALPPERVALLSKLAMQGKQ